eukprot:jgi/Tetstr1/431723/TSEL_021247.t1
MAATQLSRAEVVCGRAAAAGGGRGAVAVHGLVHKAPRMSTPRALCAGRTRRPAWPPVRPTPRARTALAAAEDDGYGMYVPPDALGGDTPENKAAKSLATLMTYVSVRIVMEQMSGDRHRSPVYNRLRDYINDEAPIRNGREWLEGLLRHPDNEMRMVGLRIMETQEIYVDKVFDWKDVQEATLIKVKQDNIVIKREWMMECMATGDDADSCAPRWPGDDANTV